MDTSRKILAVKLREKRMARLLYHAKGLWGRFTPVSWLCE
jgi:hypothetical protein